MVESTTSSVAGRNRNETRHGAWGMTASRDRWGGTWTTWISIGSEISLGWLAFFSADRSVPGSVDICGLQRTLGREGRFICHYQGRPMLRTGDRGRKNRGRKKQQKPTRLLQSAVVCLGLGPRGIWRLWHSFIVLFLHGEAHLRCLQQVVIHLLL